MIDHSYEINNVVGSGRIPTELALNPLQEDLKGHSYQNEGPQPGLHLRFQKDGPMVTFYTSGKFIARAPSEVLLFDTIKNVRQELLRLKIIPEDCEFDVSIDNVVATGKIEVDELINLSAMAIALGLKSVEYQPEDFPALIYRKPEYGCTFSLFANGKVVIAGADSYSVLEKAFSLFVEELDEFL